MNKRKLTAAGRGDVVTDHLQNPYVIFALLIRKTAHRLAEAFLVRPLRIAHFPLQFECGETAQVWMCLGVGAKLDPVAAHLLNLAPLQ